MKKQRRISPVFLVFFILIGIIFLSFVADYFGAYLLGDVVPREQTLNYQLEQMLGIVAEKLQETGELPKDLDDVKFENNFLEERYKSDYGSGRIKWYIQGDRLIIEHSGDPLKNIDPKRKKMKLPPELIPEAGQ